MKQIKKGIEIYDILDLFPELKKERNINLRKVYISLGNMINGKFESIVKESPYYTAHTPHNAVRLIVSGGRLEYDIIETIKHHINADILKISKTYIVFSIFGLKTDLPIWF